MSQWRVDEVDWSIAGDLPPFGVRIVLADHPLPGSPYAASILDWLARRYYASLNADDFEHAFRIAHAARPRDQRLSRDELRQRFAAMRGTIEELMAIGAT